jgi:predicted GIY-YIG superfamily endonuclease
MARTKTLKVLYLLHIEQHDGSASHYVGITSEWRIEARLKEHRKERKIQHLWQRLQTASRVQIQVLEREATLGIEQFYLRSCEATRRLELCEVCRRVARKENAPATQLDDAATASS